MTSNGLPQLSQVDFSKLTAPASCPFWIKRQAAGLPLVHQAQSNFSPQCYTLNMSRFLWASSEFLFFLKKKSSEMPFTHPRKPFSHVFLWAYFKNVCPVWDAKGGGPPSRAMFQLPPLSLSRVQAYPLHYLNLCLSHVAFYSFLWGHPVHVLSGETHWPSKYSMKFF